MKPLTIGKLAKLAGVGVETVRFYERQGLLAQPPRKGAGFRQYDEAVVPRLRFIRRAKELGFTLKEIAELLSLRVDPATTCAEVRAAATAKAADIEARIESLRGMRAALLKLAARCSGSGPTSECPILEALDDEHEEAGCCRPERAGVARDEACGDRRAGGGVPRREADAGPRRRG